LEGQEALRIEGLLGRNTEGFFGRGHLSSVGQQGMFPEQQATLIPEKVA